MTSAPPRNPDLAGDDDWGDDRIAAAFVARAASTPPLPSDLADAVLARIARTERARFGWPRLAVAGAAVAIAVVLGGSLLLGVVRPAPAASSNPSSGNPLATAEPESRVLEALGEPISVSEALAVRASESNEREIVVEGFLSPLFVVACPAIPVHVGNPTLLWCPASFRWLMEQPEPLATDENGAFVLGPPSGPGFHPSFALVEPPAGPASAEPGQAPISVVLMGHFHDRRAALCEASDREACGDTFLVDRVVSINGVQQPGGTERRTAATPSDLEQDVDALIKAVDPGAMVVNRLLLPIGQVIPLEPILSTDQVFPYFANPDLLVWLVTTIDVRDGLPIARTFALMDGLSWFAEITAAGATMLERTAPEPSAGTQPAVPSADPAAFVSAPTSVLGMPVQLVGGVVNQREGDLATDRDEYAIEAWYIGPRPGVTCDPPIALLHAPAPPCDEARHWLLDDPQRFGVEPGQLRRDPAQWPAVLNPVLPVDVPFDVGETWQGDIPVAQPVVVLGHFNDSRVDAFHGNVYFVIDALAWTRNGQATPSDPVVRLTTGATEDPREVLARIEAASLNAAVATWTTVLAAADFSLLDPRRAETMPEFTTGAPVWIVRRLIANERDGRERLAIEWAWTADHGSRVWWTPTPDSDADLATSIDVHDLDANTTLVRVYDYGEAIVSVRSSDGLGPLDWQAIGPIPAFIEVARGRSDREVAIRWTSTACTQSWRFDIQPGGDFIYLKPWQSSDCQGDPVKRVLVIEFDHPVDLDRFRTTDPCCG